MHYHHAPDLLLLHVPTSTLDEGSRRPGLCGNWMHRGGLLRAPYHNAMHYHHVPDLLLLHVPTSTLDEGTRRPGLCGNWMHRGALLVRLTTTPCTTTTQLTCSSFTCPPAPWT